MLSNNMDNIHCMGDHKNKKNSCEDQGILFPFNISLENNQVSILQKS